MYLGRIEGFFKDLLFFDLVCFLLGLILKFIFGKFRLIYDFLFLVFDLVNFYILDEEVKV